MAATRRSSGKTRKPVSWRRTAAVSSFFLHSPPRLVLIGRFSSVLRGGGEFAHQVTGVRRAAHQTTTKSVDLLRGGRKSQTARLKLKRSGQVLGEIIPIVAAGVEMKLMRNAARR
jgi:hypothetical protein